MQSFSAWPRALRSMSKLTIPSGDRHLGSGTSRAASATLEASRWLKASEVWVAPFTTMSSEPLDSIA